MLKKIFIITLVCVMAIGIIGCDKGSELPEYSEKQFGISGFWAPYEMTEESFKQYKDAGFNTFSMINHSGEWTSEEQFYLGSDRTMKALELCKKSGLKATLSYNDWIAERIEGEDYYGDTPFSKHDIYSEYKDIISGIHICDEPKFDPQIGIYGNETLIEDFKKVYPNADYMINLIPIYGAPYYGFESNQHMLDVYGEKFMSHFDKPYISVDIYPFHTKVEDADMYLVSNHQMIAEAAKKYNAEKTFILQASTGVEFEEDLSEGDIRWQVYAALAFGADKLQYYCYSVPKGREYNYCILNVDNTPSKLYYYVQEVNHEIQSFASAILAYDWDQSIGISGSVDQTFRVCSIEYDENLEFATLENTKHYVSAKGTQDLVLSRFVSDEYGEAYMFVNFSELTDKTNTVSATFKDCNRLAIYGGEGYSGTPEIVELDENGNVTLELAYGEGVFITPLA